MDTFASLTDIWKYFDNIEKKHFLAEDVSAAINSLPADISGKELCVYEAMASAMSQGNGNVTVELVGDASDIFTAVVKENNRTIMRTGTSPIRN